MEVECGGALIPQEHAFQAASRHWVSPAEQVRGEREQTGLCEHPSKPERNLPVLANPYIGRPRAQRGGGPRISQCGAGGELRECDCVVGTARERQRLPSARTRLRERERCAPSCERFSLENTPAFFSTRPHAPLQRCPSEPPLAMRMLLCGSGSGVCPCMAAPAPL